MQHRTPRTLYTPVVLWSLLALLTVAALVAAGTAAASAAYQTEPELASLLVINEVYDSSNPAFEYFELYNASVTATIDLTGYVIYNRDGSNNLSRLGITNTLLGPRSFKVISARDLGATTIAGSGLASTDFLALVNPASDTTVDLVNWGNAPNPGWPNFQRFQGDFFYSGIPLMPAPDGPLSLSRVPDGTDTDSDADWRANTQSPGRTNAINTPTPTGGTATPTIGCEDRFEPDDVMSQARTIEQNTEQVHTLCRSNGAVRDRDYVQFSMVGGKLYTMLTKDLTGPVDTRITLFDAQGNELADNDDYQPGQGLASRIDYTPGASGLYYLQIRDTRSNGGLGYQYTVSLISTGTIAGTATSTATPTLNPNITTTPTPGVCYDQYEPDGVPETAKLINIGTTQRHIVCPDADADWVRFYALAGKVYTIRTSNLGAGLDSFMYLFDSDMRTILAQNDDGGDNVASRIDFYPQRSDWYFAQVKNAGDIGGSEQVYDLSLAVVPGAPVPPGTATAIIAPPVGTTATAEPEPEATKPPVPTPTRAGTQPTPTPNPNVPDPVATTALQEAEPTKEPEISPPESEPTETPVEEEEGTGGEIEVEPTPTANLPGVPDTGSGESVLASVNKPAAPQPAQPEAPQPASVLFQVFFDRNANNIFDAFEGIRGLKIYFLDTTAGMASAGEVVTAGEGDGRLSLPVKPYRVYVPYLGINVELTEFPERELHSLWLPPVQLPDRVP